jgi:hypothetical protein
MGQGGLLCADCIYGVLRLTEPQHMHKHRDYAE